MESLIGEQPTTTQKLFLSNIAAFKIAGTIDKTLSQPTEVNAYKACLIASTATASADWLTRSCFCLPIDTHNEVRDNYCSPCINYSLLTGVIYIEKLWKKSTTKKNK